MSMDDLFEEDYGKVLLTVCLQRLHSQGEKLAKRGSGRGVDIPLSGFCSDILRVDSTNADALYVRGLCLYYEDCIEKAVQFFVQALRMAPDHEKACIACRVSSRHQIWVGRKDASFSAEGFRIMKEVIAILSICKDASFFYFGLSKGKCHHV